MREFFEYMITEHPMASSIGLTLGFILVLWCVFVQDYPERLFWWIVELINGKDDDDKDGYNIFY